MPIIIAAAEACAQRCLYHRNLSYPQVLAAIKAGSVDPLFAHDDRHFFAREEVQARLADAMFNPGRSFVTITGALRRFRLRHLLWGAQG